MNKDFIKQLASTIKEPVKVIEIDATDFDDLVKKVFPFLDYSVVAENQMKDGSSMPVGDWGLLDEMDYRSIYEGDVYTGVLVKVMQMLTILPDGYEFIINS